MSSYFIDADDIDFEVEEVDVHGPEIDDDDEGAWEDEEEDDEDAYMGPDGDLDDDMDIEFEAELMADVDEELAELREEAETNVLEGELALPGPMGLAGLN